MESLTARIDGLETALEEVLERLQRLERVEA